MKKLIVAPLLLLAAAACAKKAETPVEVVEAPVETPAADVAAPQEQEQAPNEEYVPTHPVERWVIADAMVDCVGVAPQRCLRVRRADEAEFKLFYSNIEGFSFQEGTRYELEVEVIPVENPPADAASERYKLVRQLVPYTGEEEKTCTTNADCGENEFCTGPAGCVVPWTCQPARPCTMDYRAFCGCDGTTIHGSGTCPPGPYRHAGECQ